MADEVKIEENQALVSEQAEIEPALLEELVKAGVLYGRKKTKTHPRMQPFIFTTRNGIEIIDVAQTLDLIGKAAEFLKEIVRRGGLILFLGTTPSAKDLVKNLAQKFGLPYVTERWMGGTLTNFKTINQRLQYFIKLRTDEATGRLEKYTKKERIQFAKEIGRLTILFGGLEPLTRLPDAIMIVDATEHTTAIREARRMKIPIICLMSTDADPDLIDYPVVANDRARSSIEWVLGKIEKAIAEAKAGVIANNANLGQNNAN